MAGEGVEIRRIPHRSRINCIASNPPVAESSFGDPGEDIPGAGALALSVSAFGANALFGADALHVPPEAATIGLGSTRKRAPWTLVHIVDMPGYR